MSQMNERIRSTFRRELGLGLIAVLVVIALTVWAFLNPQLEGTFRWLLPAVPGLMAFGIFVQAFPRMDEMERRIHLEAIAFGFGVSLLVCSVYGALQHWGDWPALNWALAAAAMTSFWALGLVLKVRRYR